MPAAKKTIRPASAAQKAPTGKRTAPAAAALSTALRKGPAELAKPGKPRKIKLVRDSFTIPSSAQREQAGRPRRAKCCARV